jgi:hypothetical protein
MQDFKGAHHILKIREELWLGGSHGRASIMVGSGFSLNAKPLSLASPEFPIWSGLTAEFAKRLYEKNVGKQAPEEFIKKQIASTSSALRLADEFESVFGREELDRVIKEAIPDQHNDPGDLHRLLLKLPWADILTTNFDTLLERARTGIVSRNYSLVETFSDIPTAVRPRIVKLHGSMSPSAPHFIITEEDFRTYPVKHASFVNLAQQSLMENTLCLVGFSGDDPNFLYWSGWVRDNLGSAAPKIYLVGLFNYPASKIKLLEARGVTVVDLSPIVPESDFLADERHQKALEWFLLSLEAGEPVDIRFWPDLITSEKTAPSHDLPPLLSPNETKGWPEDNKFPKANDKGEKEKEVMNNLKIWSEIRKKYPGWIVLPSKNRDTLWNRTKYWINPVFDAMKLKPHLLRLIPYYELAWRMEKTLMPLELDMAKEFELSLQETRGLLFGIEKISETLSEQKEAWKYLAFELLREKREKIDVDGFQKKLEILLQVLGEDDQMNPRIFYERFLMARVTGDWDTLYQILGEWPDDQEDPMWDVRRASLMAQTGQIILAEKLATKALDRIRTLINPSKPDIFWFSREGWAMHILKDISFAKLMNFTVANEQFRGRWRDLDYWGCDPNSEIRWLGRTLPENPPPDRKAVEFIANFDGGYDQNYNLSPPDPMLSAMPALNAVRLIEEASIPIRIDNVVDAKEHLVTALAWFRGRLNDWWLSVFLKTYDEQFMKKSLGQSSIAVLSKSQRDLLWKYATSTFKHLFSGLIMNSNESLKNSNKARFSDTVELVSRLCVLSPIENARSAFDMACDVYDSNIFSSFFYGIDGSLYNLFDRSIRSMQSQEINYIFLKLMNLKILDEKGLENFHGGWNDPMNCLDDLPTQVLECDNQWLEEKILWLISIAKEDQPRRRITSMHRLVTVFRLNKFPTKLLSDFANALWGKLNKRTNLPDHTGLNMVAFVYLPSPPSVNVVDIFKKLCTSTPVLNIYSESKDPAGRVSWTLNDHDPGIMQLVYAARAATDSRVRDKIQWGKDEVRTILESIFTWWRREGHTLNPSQSTFMEKDAVDARLKKVIQIIADLVAPILKGDEASLKKAREIWDGIESVGFSTNHWIYGKLCLYPEKLDECCSSIRGSLVSRNFSQSIHAAFGIFYWIKYFERMQIPKPPKDLIAEISRIVATRGVAVRSALNIFIALAQDKDFERIDRESINNILVGLEYLYKEATYELGLESELFFNVAETRRISVEMAHVLIENKLSNASILHQWIKSGKEDPIIAVRQEAEKIHIVH